MPPSWKERLVCALGLREKRCVACREPFEPAGFPHGAVLTIEEATAFFLCPQCAERIRRRTSGFCPYCGEPSVMEEAPCTSCSECMVQLPPWSDFLFFGVYEGLLRAVKQLEMKLERVKAENNDLEAQNQDKVEKLRVVKEQNEKLETIRDAK